MKAFPKTLNSWKDVLYVTENFPKEKWEGKVRALIDEDVVKVWNWVKVLNSKAEGITDATHKIVEQEVTVTVASSQGTDASEAAGTDTGTSGTDTPTVTKKIQYIQYELRYNLQCKLARMKKCKTDEALIAAIAEVKALLGDEPEAEPEPESTAAGVAEPKTETAGTTEATEATEATATPVPEATAATATANKTTKTKK